MATLIFQNEIPVQIDSEQIKVLNTDIVDEIDMGDEDCTKFVTVVSSITIYVKPKQAKYFDKNELQEIRYGWYNPAYSLQCHELSRFKMSNGGLVIHYGTDDSVITKTS